MNWQIHHCWRKSSTKDVEKVTDELADMKKSVVTIIRKGLDNFEGQSKGSTEWFKFDSGVFKNNISTIHSEFYKELFENNIEDQDTELYTTFIVLSDKESIKTKYEKNGPNMITQSEAPAQEGIEVQKH